MIPGMMHLRKTHDSAAHRLPYPLYRVVVGGVERDAGRVWTDASRPGASPTFCRRLRNRQRRQKERIHELATLRSFPA